MDTYPSQPVSGPLRAALTRLTAVTGNRTGDPVWAYEAAAALTVLHATGPIPYEPLDLPPAVGPPIRDAVAELRRVQTDLRAVIDTTRSGAEALRCADAWAQLDDALTFYEPAADGPDADLTGITG